MTGRGPVGGRRIIGGGAPRGAGPPHRWPGGAAPSLQAAFCRGQVRWEPKQPGLLRPGIPKLSGRTPSLRPGCRIPGLAAPRPLSRPSLGWKLTPPGRGPCDDSAAVAGLLKPRTDWDFASVVTLTFLGFCLFVMTARTALPSCLPRSLAPKPLNDPCVRQVGTRLSNPRPGITSGKKTPSQPVVIERPRRASSLT